MTIYAAPLLTRKSVLSVIAKTTDIMDTFLLPTDAHNVKKRRVIKTF